MNLQELIHDGPATDIRAAAMRAARATGIDWRNNPGVQGVFDALLANEVQAPNIRGDSVDEMLRKWFQKYRKGFDNRPSQRSSNPPGTVPDPVIDCLLQTRLPHLQPAAMEQITYGHRLAMSAENILGPLLEEFLAIHLARHGWFCCWGETMRSVDFANQDGRLLQVKNRSNSENSSSSRVRIGTEISRWFRVNATSGEYLWEDLNRMNGTGNLTEERFVEFARATLRNNPAALAVEAGNPWGRV